MPCPGGEEWGGRRSRRARAYPGLTDRYETLRAYALGTASVSGLAQGLVVLLRQADRVLACQGSLPYSIA